MRELVGELEALVREHPLRERLRGQLMLALYRSGRQADALEVYRDGRAALVDELGIEPSPLLQQLHASILRQEAPPPGEGTTPAPRALRGGRRAAARGRSVTIVGRRRRRAARDRARAPLRPRRGAARAAARLAGDRDAERRRARSTTRCTRSSRQTARRRRCIGSSPRLPAQLRERGAGHPLLVTTGYELALEQALDEAGEEFDSVCYIASGPHRGSFCHVCAGRQLRRRSSGRTRTRPSSRSSERTVVLHLQGRVDASPERAWESFAVTEDDFIHYGDVAGRLPVALAARLRRSHLLLLGYTLSDWTLRVVLERLWGEEPLGYRSWSVHAGRSRSSASSGGGATSRSSTWRRPSTSPSSSTSRSGGVR